MAFLSHLSSCFAEKNCTSCYQLIALIGCKGQRPLLAKTFKPTRQVPIGRPIGTCLVGLKVLARRGR